MGIFLAMLVYWRVCLLWWKKVKLSKYLCLGESTSNFAPVFTRVFSKGMETSPWKKKRWRSGRYLWDGNSTLWLGNPWGLVVWGPRIGGGPKESHSLSVFLDPQESQTTGVSNQQLTIIYLIFWSDRKKQQIQNWDHTYVFSMRHESITK